MPPSPCTLPPTCPPRSSTQVEHTKAERRIMGGVDHPFIVSLRFAFHTADKVRSRPRPVSVSVLDAADGWDAAGVR